MSKELGGLVVKECTPEQFEGEVDLVFSGLDSDVAGDTGRSRSRPTEDRERWRERERERKKKC